MTRTIKFNIKHFIEEYIYCVESKDEDGEVELTEQFKRVFLNSSPQIQQGIQSYLMNNKNAKEYVQLQKIASNCTLFFTS